MSYVALLKKLLRQNHIFNPSWLMQALIALCFALKQVYNCDNGDCVLWFQNPAITTKFSTRIFWLKSDHITLLFHCLWYFLISGNHHWFHSNCFFVPKLVNVFIVECTWSNQKGVILFLPFFHLLRLLSGSCCQQFICLLIRDPFRVFVIF